jgi:type I restriction enzyme S subunit
MIPRQPRYSRYILSSSQVKARLNPIFALPEFYYYWFRTLAGQRALLANASTVGVPGIASPLATIRSISVPIPDLSVQQAIVDTLGALDDKIAVNERIVLACHQLAQAYVASAVDSAARVALSELADITMGSSPPGDTYNEGRVGLPFYQGTRDFGFRFPSRRVWCTDPVRTSQSGATLVSVRAPGR